MQISKSFPEAVYRRDTLKCFHMSQNIQYTCCFIYLDSPCVLYLAGFARNLLHLNLGSEIFYDFIKSKVWETPS